MTNNYVRVSCSSIFDQEKTYTNRLYSFPIITISYMMDYLVSITILIINYYILYDGLSRFIMPILVN